MYRNNVAALTCTALMRIGTRMATGFDREFDEHGMTQALFRTLLAVWEEGGAQGIAPSVLADRLLLERATVTVLTTRLVERGLLARLPGENRRTFNLVLTEKGDETLNGLGPPAIALARQTLEGIPTAEIEQLYSLLQRIEERLRGAVEPTPPPVRKEGE